MRNVVVVCVVSLVACTSLDESVVEQEVTTCVTFQRGTRGPVADAYIKKNALHKNYGSLSVLKVSDKEQSLLSFDLASIPQQAVISRATLKLYVNGNHGDGTIRVLESQGQVIVDNSGNPVRLVGTCLDITDRRPA